MPISNISQLERFTALCGASIPSAVRESLAPIRESSEDVIEFGTNYAIQQCRALLDGGAPGIDLLHTKPLGADKADNHRTPELARPTHRNRYRRSAGFAVRPSGEPHGLDLKPDAEVLEHRFYLFLFADTCCGSPV